MLILGKFYWYLTHIDDYADRQAEEYKLLQSCYYIFAIVGIYLAFVFKIGPCIMKSREPMQLRNFILIYNVLQILGNTYCLYQGYFLFSTMNWFCNIVDRSHSPRALLLVYLHHMYFLLKISDLIDTIIMVLRKKTKQISFLHVYHHTAMALGSWTTLKYIPGGQQFFVGACNCFVHVVMYAYYFLAAWKPEYSKNAWWKKYLTQLQLLQHILVTLCFCFTLFHTNCEYNKVWSQFFVTQGFFFISLFSHFYYKSYMQNKN